MEQDTIVFTESVKQISCAKCGKPLDVAMLPPFSKFRCGHCHAVQTVPAKFGNFVLLDLLGRGGMAAVYRGLDKALGRQVAIKFMLRSLGADQEFYAQFKREARAAAALSHPNIVQIYALGEEKGQAFIVMELLSGGRLDQMITARKRLDEATVLRIGLEVAEGMNAAHRVGLIHDDIKPENILFDAKGTAKVVDFGLARIRGRGPQSGQNEIWGTPYYIAPEKVLRKAPDFRSDIYSLGGTLFHALIGRPPFEGETAVDVVKARLQQPPPDVKALRPDVQPGTADLLGRMLARDPEQRPASYEALLDELRGLAGAGPGQTGPIPPGGKSTRLLVKGKRFRYGEGEAGTSSGAPAVPRRPIWPMVLIVALAVALLGGGVAGLAALAFRRRAHREAADRQAALVAMQAQGRAFYEAAAVAATGTLAEAEGIYFYDVAATGRLAEARAILAGLGDQAKLVSLPLLPDEGEIARQLEAAVLGGYGAITNLEQVCEEAGAARDRLESAGPETPAENRAILARLKELAESILPLARAVDETRQTAGRLLEDADGWVRRAQEARDAALQEAERLAAEAEARRKREAEAAERKRLEAERLARIEGERAAVREAWEANLERLRQNRFAEAADALKQALAPLETDEGKADARTAEERCRLLEEMKQFLIAALRDKPLRWGWFRGAGQIDIDGADAEGIRVRGTVEPWSAVDARQMLKFVESFIKPDDGRDRAGGKRAWARLHLAAAVYCYLQGERAYGVARGYALLAVQYDAKLEAEWRRLMPDLTPE